MTIQLNWSSGRLRHHILTRRSATADIARDMGVGAHSLSL